MMTGPEIKEAMQNGVDRFQHRKTGRVFLIDPAQSALFDDGDEDGLLLMGFPEDPSKKQRGRKWQWLAPKNLEIAPST